MQDRALFADTFISQPSILKRLGEEFSEAIGEFKENPSAYLTSAIRGDGIGGRRRQRNLLYGLAVSLMVFSTIFLAILIAFTVAHAKDNQIAENQEEFIPLTSVQDFEQQKVDAPKAKQKAGGGGGGGRETPTPPSKGQLPKFDLTPPLIAPRPEPQLHPPQIPIPETVQVDPRLQPKRDDLAPTGLPTGVEGPPSPGPGKGGGMGTGDQGGMGSGNGRGVGPGTGYNTGGGPPGLGGGDRNTPQSVVDSKPVALNNPRPNYTEAARQNKIQGNIRAKVLVGPDGDVKKVSILSHLPDGLDEQAIEAAYKLRFRPAMKNGQGVAYWVTVEIGFTLR
jgi:TonB family protein